MTTDTARAEDGAAIAFDVVGDGEPLVLLAGQANARRWWDPVRADFSGSFRTIAVDTVGTGQSGEPGGGGYSTRRFARDVVAVLDALGVERAHVYGTSMGGKVAQWLAVDHAERLGALVLGCTSPGGAGGLVAEPEVLRSLRGPKGGVVLLDLMFTRAFVDRHRGPWHVLGDTWMSNAARVGHRRASEAHDAWDWLGGVAAPTLVLHGTEDRFSPVGNARFLADLVPGAELVLIEGARHAYFEEFRERASAEVVDFLRRHPLT
ncbi:alpha/beta fold hydrolase [Actinokineospora pegani]|uniref:alpha/beta fold hydrolase n=1 Tax=Actinokineospora pegani TaxID=2654637 RepID=UPI0012E9B2B3|nr:alpha/beta fold hydrolase [Actinokineospora pegani]